MPRNRPADAPATIDVALVQHLIRSQFPHWAGREIRPVSPQGWDNRTFRLGPDLSVRLPSAERYRAQVEKEQAWLPRLAPLLPLPIPVPLALGAPDDRFPWPWSVYRWLEGESAATGVISDPPGCALALAGFLRALQLIDASDGPVPGAHNFFRGGSLAVYEGQTLQALASLAGELDLGAAAEIWAAARASEWQGAPVWLHGDVSAGNLLLREGHLAAVIDFGSAGVGDPACDLTIAWTLFDGEIRAAFRAALPLDEACWARARGWALWKALITLAEQPGRDDPPGRSARAVLAAVLADVD